MKEKKTHILLRLLSIVLTVAVLAPAMIKYTHGFQDHEHEVCFGKSESHLHELDIDCEFFKFKLNTQYVHVHKLFSTIDIEHTTPIITSHYQLISDYQKLSFSLRGPPSLS